MRVTRWWVLGFSTTFATSCESTTLHFFKIIFYLIDILTYVRLRDIWRIHQWCFDTLTQVSWVALMVKNPLANTGDLRHVGSTPGSGRSPGGEHGNPLWCSCLENPMNGGAWRATVHRVAKNWTRLKQLSTKDDNDTPTENKVEWLIQTLWSW